MNSLDQSFASWLQELADSKRVSIEEEANQLGPDEIDHRCIHYPLVWNLLMEEDSDLDELAPALRACWALTGRFNSTRLNLFLANDRAAARVIRRLLEHFPENPNDSASRIDDFVLAAVGLGFSQPDGSKDYAGAALLASVLLTCCLPDRFVDYRQLRWERLAKALAYPSLRPVRARYGSALVWAGKFAQDVIVTDTFRLYWPGPDALWTLAGVCWADPQKQGIVTEPPDLAAMASFGEGAEMWRLHLQRERNRAVVRLAKKLGRERDPLLQCAVCGFSFQREYGPIGSDYVEAHHNVVPVARLKRGDRTRVEDIVLVCSNCHNMLHRGKPFMLTIEELQKARAAAGAAPSG